MKRAAKTMVKSFLFEALVYGVLVVAYFFLVLHFLGDWLYQLYRDERTTYAGMALVLIIGQGIALEILTRSLLQLVKPKRSRLK